MSTYKFGQCWVLDETGNWTQFQQDLYGTHAWSFNQQRTNNPVNEITNITETAGPSWANPAYDAAGNMTIVDLPCGWWALGKERRIICEESIKCRRVV